MDSEWSRRTFLRLAAAGGGAWGGGAWEAAAGGLFTRNDVPGPEIIDCAGWGARRNRAVVPIRGARPVRIIVHHTATPNVTDRSRRAAEALARGIQNFHMDRRGWIDSGQQFTISRGGFVLEGRHRSLEVLRLGRRQVQGAHCTGQNTVSVGIENEGTYTGAEPPTRQWNRLREMCAHVCRQYGIDPGEILGHRDFRNTACPGDRLYAALPRLRAEVADALGMPGVSAQKASWPLLREGDRGVSVAAAQLLLRAAGARDVPLDGEFGPSTTAAVRGFQTRHRAEDVNGLLGGESWPTLARTVRIGQGGDAERAVAALAAAQGSDLPDVVTAPVWQRLLGTGGTPIRPARD